MSTSSHSSRSAPARTSPRSAAAIVALVIGWAIGLTVSLPAQEVGWAWINPAGQGTTFTPFSAWQFSTAGGQITVTRGSGNHEFHVNIPGAAPSVGGCVHATAHGGNHTAVVTQWLTSSGDVDATIRLFDSNGNPANDKAFTIHWRHEGPGLRREAYVWANLATALSYTPSLVYSWNGNRPDPIVTRSGVGTYQVRFPGLAPIFNSEDGSVQVSPHSSTPVRAKVASWFAHAGDVIVNVRCFQFNGTPTDARFLCSYQEVAAPIDEKVGSGAHVWAHNSTSTYSVPSPAYTDSNGCAGPPDQETVERLSTGRYLVNLPDLAPHSSSTVQVTAQGTGSEYASIYNWVSDGCGGTNITVETWNPNGTPADARFTLLYLTNRPATTLPAVAWAWIQPLGQGQTFTPIGTYQYTSSGQNITVKRLSSNNKYEVEMPRMHGEGGGVFHVTPHGGNHLVTVNPMSTNNGAAKAFVQTFQFNGLPANDAAFTISFRRSGRRGAREAYASSFLALHPNTYAIGSHWNSTRGRGSRVRPTRPGRNGDVIGPERSRVHGLYRRRSDPTADSTAPHANLSNHDPGNASVPRRDASRARRRVGARNQQLRTGG